MHLLQSYVVVYKRLPVDLVNASTVLVVQTRLTHMGMARADRGDSNWKESLQSCADLMRQFGRT